jgi:hypothetical protein
VLKFRGECGDSGPWGIVIFEWTKRARDFPTGLVCEGSQHSGGSAAENGSWYCCMLVKQEKAIELFKEFAYEI